MQPFISSLGKRSKRSTTEDQYQWSHFARVNYDLCIVIVSIVCTKMSKGAESGCVLEEMFPLSEILQMFVLRYDDKCPCHDTLA